MRPLDARSRRTCLIVTAFCLAATAALAVRVHGRARALIADGRGARLIDRLISPQIARDVQHLADPVIFAVIVALLTLVAARMRDALLLVVAGVGPPLAVLTTEHVAKPLIGRHEGTAFGFPSGHTAAAAALATVCVLLAWRQWGSPGVRWVLPWGVGLALVMTAAVVRVESHLFTDAVGGVLTGVAVVLVVAVLTSAAGGDAPRRPGATARI